MFSLCGNEAASIATSGSKNDTVIGKPRIIELKTSIAPDVGGRSGEDEIEADAVIPVPKEETDAIPDSIHDEEDLDAAPSATPSSPQHNDNPASEEPSRRWVVDFRQVWVEDSPAWEEQVPIYSHSEESVCNICGATITGDEAPHGKTHMLAGEGSGHHAEYINQIAGYDTVHHDAVGHWEIVEDGGHWE